MDLIPIVEDIHRLEKRLYEAMDQLHHYENTGQLPPKKIEINADNLPNLSIWDLINRRANLLSRASREKKAGKHNEEATTRKEAKYIEEMLKRLPAYNELIHEN